MSKPRTLDPQQSTARTAVPATQRFVPLAYRIDDAAAVIGVSDGKVWRLIREGRIPARKLDGSTVIRHEDLTAFIDGLPLVRQLAEPSAIPPPEPPPPIPRPNPCSAAPAHPAAYPCSAAPAGMCSSASAAGQSTARAAATEVHTTASPAGSCPSG